MEHLMGYLQTVGYPALFLILLVESLGVPSPSELAVVLAGYLVFRGELSLPGVILAGAAGSTVGASLAYLVAVRGGRPFLERYAGAIHLDRRRLTAVEDWFARHGGWAVFFGRLLTGVRALISYPAGIFGMAYPRFAICTVGGALLYTALFATGSMLLGPQFQVLLVWMRPGPALYLLLGLVVVLGLGYLLWRRRRQPAGG
ncbi:MAG: DedA family protein [Thermaerobacter sp.]|jgi:LPXTG-motif cell wall-anchored protein|nr:DedA family protein [Thermaerobacter sp.]